MQRTATRSGRLLVASLALAGAVLLGVAAQASEPPQSELDRGRQMHALGQRTEALAHYRAFLAQPDTPTADRASALNNVCLLLHDLGEVQEALDSCKQALALRREVDDERRLARTLNNYGLVLQSSGRWDEARRAYEEALRSNRARDDQPAVAVNLANLGLLAGDEGRYGRALDHLLEVESLATRYQDEPWADEQRLVAWINRGVVYEKLGAFDQALELYQRLVAEEERLGPRRWATVLMNLGTVYRNLGDPHQAASAYGRASKIFQQEDDRAALASARLNLGQVLSTDLRQPIDAESELRRALTLARQVGDRGVEIQALFLLGELYLEGESEDDPEASNDAFGQCLELARASGSAEGEWWALFGLGRLAAREERLGEALGYLTASIEVLERTRARVDDRDLRSGFIASWRHVYEAAVEVLWRRHERGAEDAAPAAFSLVQRAKERELLEALGVDVRSAGPLELKPLRTALRGVSDTAILVEYFVAADALHAFRLDTTDADLRWWRGDSPARHAARRVHLALAAGASPDAGDLRALSKALLPALDLGSRDSADEGVQRLLVAPDGALRYLPFEVLGFPGEKSTRLVDRYVVSYLPSSSALSSRGTPSSPDAEPRYGFVGLADPAPAAWTAGSGDGSGDEDGGSTFRSGGTLAARFSQRIPQDRLPSGRREIADAAGRLPGEHVLLVDGEATVAALREAVAQGTRVLHLAAHTLVDERPGGGAAVVLAPDESNAEESSEDGADGLLGPSDLARLDLRSGLTVLAACRTALPTDDGPAQSSAFGSLTGSFLAAGSNAVLATLWEVGDEATEVFMQQFYFELSEGNDPARALTEVKRRLANDPRWGAPHLWSAYVLVGHSSPVVTSRALDARIAVVGILLLAILVVSLLWLTRRGAGQGAPTT